MGLLIWYKVLSIFYQFIMDFYVKSAKELLLQLLNNCHLVELKVQYFPVKCGEVEWNNKVRAYML